MKNRILFRTPLLIGLLLLPLGCGGDDPTGASGVSNRRLNCRRRAAWRHHERRGERAVHCCGDFL